jgi:hypothetical protein
MFTVKKTILILAAALAVLPGFALAQGKGGDKPTGTTTVPVGGEMSLDGLAKKYGAFAGSPENAQSLVSGLRNGTEVVLTGIEQPTGQVCTSQVMEPCPPLTGPGGIPLPPIPGSQPQMCAKDKVVPCPPSPVRETFTPPTGNMGLGNVDIALAFAQAQLLELGIKTPSPKETKASLMGGQVTGSSNSRNLPGILTLRAGGMGWGQIANQLGYKLQ